MRRRLFSFKWAFSTVEFDESQIGDLGKRFVCERFEFAPRDQFAYRPKNVLLL
jgi:hypothetical protein